MTFDDLSIEDRSRIWTYCAFTFRRESPLAGLPHMDDISDCIRMAIQQWEYSKSVHLAAVQAGRDLIP